MNLRRDTHFGRDIGKNPGEIFRSDSRDLRFTLFRLRSYLGYPPVRDAQPNTTHFALAALQHLGVVSRLITQNVDGLHHKAISSVWDRSQMEKRMLELHGTLHVRTDFSQFP